ncbi:imelysin family protein [Terrihabitans sp. B22-R8]|uniref:imelysin family protein n=1 Tax=Terrihabitans sp. B22-R8 TaxID=3425128 RepID=UPI00403C4CA2
MRAVLCLLVFLFGATTASAQNATVRPDAQKAIVIRLARDFVAPRYMVLRDAAIGQKQAWDMFCTAPSAEGLGALKHAFAQTALAWSAVDLVRFGPVSEGFRHERLLYWPERRNEVDRALTRLLAEDGIDAQAMPGKSVAVQGLAALERLLHDDNAGTRLAASDEPGRRRCAAGRAMADNVAAISDEVADAWKALAAGLDAANEVVVREMAARFATDLVTAFGVIGDRKIDVPLGPSLEEAKPKAAQFWRSGLSSRVLAANLKAAADLAAAVVGEDAPATRALREAEDRAVHLSAPVSDLVGNVNGGRELLLLRNAIRMAGEETAASVPPALGVMVGFNSLDGD